MPSPRHRLISELRKGPPASRVDDVNIEAAEIEATTGFMRRST